MKVLEKRDGETLVLKKHDKIAITFNLQKHIHKD